MFHFLAILPCRHCDLLGLDCILPTGEAQLRLDGSQNGHAYRKMGLWHGTSGPKFNLVSAVE